MVGMVVTISPSLSVYKMVVLPAASRPTIKMRISFLPKKSNSFEKLKPIFWNQELKKSPDNSQKRARGWLSLLPARDPKKNSGIDDLAHLMIVILLPHLPIITPLIQYCLYGCIHSLVS